MWVSELDKGTHHSLTSHLKKFRETGNKSEVDKLKSLWPLEQ